MSDSKFVELKPGVDFMGTTVLPDSYVFYVPAHGYGDIRFGIFRGTFNPYSTNFAISVVTSCHQKRKSFKDNALTEPYLYTREITGNIMAVSDKALDEFRSKLENQNLPDGYFWSGKMTLKSFQKLEQFLKTCKNATE